MPNARTRKLDPLNSDWDWQVDMWGGLHVLAPLAIIGILSVPMSLLRILFMDDPATSFWGYMIYGASVLWALACGPFIVWVLVASYRAHYWRTNAHPDGLDDAARTKRFARYIVPFCVVGGIYVGALVTLFLAMQVSADWKWAAGLLTLGVAVSASAWIGRWLSRRFAHLPTESELARKRDVFMQKSGRRYIKGLITRGLATYKDLERFEGGGPIQI